MAILLVYFHVFMEWLFFVTKPSFFSALGSRETILTLLITPLPLAALAAAVVATLWLAARATPSPSGAAVAQRLARGVSAFIGVCCLLILADNFTLTILGFGIRHAEHVWRWLYALSCLALWLHLDRATARVAAAVCPRARSRVLYVATMALLASSSAGAAVAWVSSAGRPAADPEGPPTAAGLPNILLLGGDGLSAEHMSCYGYHRDTTPFLRELMTSALVFQNHFPNAGSSGASTASMLTGKLPTRTRLIYPPDILRGRDAYQHLPAILRRAGYHSIEISMRHYADAYDLNMRDSFDSANFRQIGSRRLGPLGRKLGAVFYSPIYFLGQVWERLEERLLHVSGIRTMVDAFDEATTAKKETFRDPKRIEELLGFIERSPEPFFAHVHLCGTHGKTFEPLQREFSKGQEQDRQWMVDFYDDAVLDFDAHVRTIVEQLSKRGKLDRTILVINTDHGMGWATSARVPLMIRLPGGHSGVGADIEANTQNLDLAPTLLDYLGLGIPEWMQGMSLIASPPERMRPIFGFISRQGAESKEGWFTMPESRPPFFNLRAVSVVICHRSFRLELPSNELWLSEVSGHTAPCAETEIPDPAEVRALIVDHLRDNAYDASSLSSGGR